MRVRITDFITLLKNMALSEGYAPKGIRAQVEVIEEHSRIYPLDDFDNKKRNKIKLPSLPTQSDVARQLIEVS
jgi:heterodisulfide reductase subunit C